MTPWVILHSLHTAHIYITLSRHRHMQPLAMCTLQVFHSTLLLKPPVASAADVEGSNRCCGWNAKAPACGAECPWTQRGCYYLPLCLLCLLSSALQGPPQKVLEIKAWDRPERLSFYKRDESRKKHKRQGTCMRVCVHVCVVEFKTSVYMH